MHACLGYLMVNMACVRFDDEPRRPRKQQHRCCPVERGTDVPTAAGAYREVQFIEIYAAEQVQTLIDAGLSN